jgi:hypothetical protein
MTLSRPAATVAIRVTVYSTIAPLDQPLSFVTGIEFTAVRTRGFGPEKSSVPWLMADCFTLWG